MSIRTCALSAIIVLAAGCGSDDTAAKEASKPAEGRPETAPLEAASAVGYDGHALRKSLDKTLDAADKHNQEVQKAAEGEAPDK